MVKQKAELRNIELRIAYVGSRFSGWQVQPHALTVQGVLQQALRKTLGEPELKTSGASRTDAGVHAHDQCVSFRTRSGIPCEGLQRSLQNLLPLDIRVLEVRERDRHFSARFDARAKHYLYLIYNAGDVSPFVAPYMWSHRMALDVAVMNRCAQSFVGTQCFKVFQAACDYRDETQTTIYSASVVRLGNLVCFDVVGRHFLYHMVRNMAGTLQRVGTGEWSYASFLERFESGDRTQVAMTAPAEGLHLFEVFYDDPPYQISPRRERFLAQLSV